MIDPPKNLIIFVHGWPDTPSDLFKPIINDLLGREPDTPLDNERIIPFLDKSKVNPNFLKEKTMILLLELPGYSLPGYEDSYADSN